MFSSEKTVNIQGSLINLATPSIVGVLNVTPDSFFDGGRYVREKDMLLHVERMLGEGADFIDVGGASARPGAQQTPLEEELNRVVPAIRSIRRAFPHARLLVDTFRAAVAERALDEGVVMINDISGGQLDEVMFSIVARYQVPYVLTHTRGTSKTMQSMVSYDELLCDLTQYFQEKILKLHQCGVKDVIVDPGIGFAKTSLQNFEILKHLDCLHILDKPLLIGLSRKTLIWDTLNIRPEHALNGSTVLHTLALLKGVAFLRVHDVKEAVEAAKLVSFVQ